MSALRITAMERNGVNNSKDIIWRVATRNQVHRTERELDRFPGCLQLLHQTIPIPSATNLTNAEVRSKATDPRLEVLFVGDCCPQCCV